MKLININLYLGKLLSLFVVVCPLLASCSKDNFSDELNKKLQGLDNINSITKLQNTNKSFTCQYEIYFNMPLDWNKPTENTFKQRVIIDAKAFDIPTVVELHGYALGDKYITEGYTRELPVLLNTNFIAIEHRYFNLSIPSAPDYENSSYWDALTVENASKDHEFIIKQLRKVFTNKWIATGTSKGGYVTNVLASYHPDTCDIYVPYVAPLAKQFDNRPFKFLSETAGNKLFGEKRGKEVREEILNFQIYCFEHKDELVDLLFSEQYCSKDARFRSAVSHENIFDINMLEFAYIFWQYQRLDISVIEDFLKLEDSSEKVKKAADIIKLNDTSVEAFRYNKPHYPYYVTALKEMGNLHYDFTYIKEQASALGKTINVSIPKEQEIEVYTKMIYSDNQLKNFVYSDSVYNHLVGWINDTTINTKVIMINGLEDPWFYVSIPQPLKRGENINIYNHPTGNHTVQITDFADNEKNEILNLLNTWLNEKQ